ncbi:CbtA family protein [Polaromonas sp.]|uniref:CbtA family protein n=1 Tax=Polaromonas sp. TaxID=1869339 RepID=UPI0017CEBFF7|nr:CbtA family protein [Polaromonas sp.]NMM05229.1 hypothetical protein [Polaromonas sp.]
MLFRRLFLCALLVGLLTGLFDSAVQRWQVVPLILAAEVFEESAAPSHAAQDWAPQDGLERTAYTVLANVLNAIGAALLLMPLLAWWNRQRTGQALALHQGYGASVRYGLLWGAAGWVCLFALPALGLPPELPGMQAAALQARQLWWALTVVCGAGGLAMLCLVRAKWRVLGLGLLVLPFAIGAPLHTGSPFAGMEADVALQMQQLASRFVVATAVASALQWLLLGVLSALAVARWLSPLLNPVAAATRLEGSAS